MHILNSADLLEKNTIEKGEKIGVSSIMHKTSIN